MICTGDPRAKLVMSTGAEAGLSVVWDGASYGPVLTAARIQFVPLSSCDFVAVASLKVKRRPKTHRTVAFNVVVGIHGFLFCLFIYLETR